MSQEPSTQPIHEDIQETNPSPPVKHEDPVIEDKSIPDKNNNTSNREDSSAATPTADMTEDAVQPIHDTNDGE